MNLWYFVLENLGYEVPDIPLAVPAAAPMTRPRNVKERILERSYQNAMDVIYNENFWEAQRINGRIH